MLHSSGFRLIGSVMLAELFVVARNFGEEDLRHRLEQLLEAFITEDNVCKIYSAAVQRNSKVPSAKDMLH